MTTTTLTTAIEEHLLACDEARVEIARLSNPYNARARVLRREMSDMDLANESGDEGKILMAAQPLYNAAVEAHRELCKLESGANRAARRLRVANRAMLDAMEGDDADGR